MKIRLPVDSYYQKMLSFKSNPPPLSVETTGEHRHAVYNFSGGIPDIIQVTLCAQLVPTGANALTISNELPENLALYKAGTDFYSLDYPPMKKVLNEITQEAKTENEKAEAIINWTGKNIIYMTNLPRFKGKTVTPKDWPKYKNSTQLFEEKWGHCGQFSQMAVAMLRSIGIPSRTAYGWYAGHDGSVTTHVTVEYYNSQLQRWIYMEPQNFIPTGLSSASHLVDTREQVEDGALSLAALFEWDTSGKFTCRELE